MAKTEERKRETRFFAMQGQPRIRESEDGKNDSRIIEGYAIVFGVQSKLLVDWGDVYREIIEPGAITQEDLVRFDIKMTIWHNRERLLARSNHGKGTLTLTVDEIGVKYSFVAPNTPDGDTALELVKRGDLSGSSFIFWSDETTSVSYTKDEEGIIVRHVNRIDEIFDMTIASDPAYVQTNVTAREIDEAIGEVEKKDEDTDKGIALEEHRSREKHITGIRTSAKQEFYY